MNQELTVQEPQSLDQKTVRMMVKLFSKGLSTADISDIVEIDEATVVAVLMPRLLEESKACMPPKPYSDIPDSCFIDSQAVGRLTNDSVTHIYPDGSIFQGTLKDGLKQGFGKTVWRNDESYEGQYLNNKKHGKGKFTYEHQDYYEGYWLNDLQHGFGVLKTPGEENSLECNWDTGFPVGEIIKRFGNEPVLKEQFNSEIRHLKDSCWTELHRKEILQLSQAKAGQREAGFTFVGSPDEDLTKLVAVKVAKTCGEVYEGQMVNSKKDGQGTLTLMDGSSYSGSWKNDVMHGYGAYRWVTTGDFYEGEFVDDKRTGKGTITCEDGTCYTGMWRDDLKHGYGVYIWPSGNRYEGEFKDDRFEGKATLVYADDGSTYTGDFIDAKEHGFGTYVWANGDRYEGEFRGGERNGQGQARYGNGKAYKGSWKADMMHGPGEFTEEDGAKYKGNFAFELKDGRFTRTKPGEKRRRETWKLGFRVS